MAASRRGVSGATPPSGEVGSASAGADAPRPRVDPLEAERGHPGGPTLASTFDPRANSLDMLRLILATTVAVAHAGAIGYGRQPRLGVTEVGAMAVDAFFVLSGFLVARSYLQLGSLGRYAWHRFLRIMPGFWICLLVTAAVVAPLIAVLEGRPAFSVFPQAWSYLTHNGALFMRNFAVADLPTQTNQPFVVNGALWTLFYEAVCYVGVGVLGVFGVLRRSPWLVAVGTLATFAVIAGQGAGLVPVHGELFLRFFLMFGLGTLGLLYARRLSMRGSWAVLALLVLAVTLALGHDYRGLGGGFAFAYLCLFAMARTPWLRQRPRADLSYGMYVYHWPIETLLVLAGATALTQVGYTLLAVICAGLAALVSWQLVEHPALARKSMAPLRIRRDPERHAPAKHGLQKHAPRRH